IDRGVDDGAALLPFVGDQRVLAVEEQQPQFLDFRKPLSGVAIVDQRLPRRQHGPLGDPGTVASASLSAPSTPARLPKRAMAALATGFMSPRGCAENSRNSSTS